MDYNNLRNSEKSELMRINFKRWKVEALDEAGYFIIFQGFLENGILKELSGNALKLYLYLGLNSNNLEGTVWHSNNKISKYFQKSERTIRTWMNELESLNLIKRMRLKYNGNVYTHLQPYKYKYNPTAEYDLKQIIEGTLYIDEINSLYIKGINLYVPITSSMYIDLWYSPNNIWISGKIEIRRLDVDWHQDEYEIEQKIRYVFRSFDKSLILNIEKNKQLRVRVLLI